MTLPLRIRLALGGAICLLPMLAAWWLISTRDLARTLRDFLAGRGLTWPPPPKPDNQPSPVEQGGEATAHAASTYLIPALLALLALALLVVVNRARRRRERAAATKTWELRLGRDDIATPYRVQEAMESILGAIGSRWYERVWRGQDHIAFETHRLANGSVAFTVAAPRHLERVLRGGLEDLYPDVQLIETAGRPSPPRCVVRLKKRRAFVFSLLTVRNYDHALSESLVAQLAALDEELTVQLVLAPAPDWAYRRARRLFKGRERTLQNADHRDPGELGIDSVIEYKELKGALDTQHHALAAFDVRVAGADAHAVRQIAGLFSATRSENELVRREMRLRRRLYARRVLLALPNPLLSWQTGFLSTSELATLWQLPRGRSKHAPVRRSSVRRAIAPPEVERTEARALMHDERGPVSLALADRKYGHALIGGQGGGKSSVLARHFSSDAADPDCAIIAIDFKGSLAELLVGIAPAHRTVHELDLGRPELGFNPLAIRATPDARADLVLRALIEANPPGAIQAASDSFLRQAIAAVCAVEAQPTLWHVYRMLDAGPGRYREDVIRRLESLPGHDFDFAVSYWRRSFPALISDRGFAAQALNPPRNKLERLIATRSIDTLLRHPNVLDIEDVLDRNEILVVNAAKATVGEDNAILVIQLLLQLIHRALHARQRLPEDRRHGRISLIFDEVHNALTRTLATALAEGRSVGLQAVLAWQYSQQIRDELVRSGVRSLLQSISVFRMREMEDARALAALAMEVYTDRISVDADEQERLRFGPDDINRLPVHQAINLWVADGIPRPGFIGHTMPMEDLYDERLAQHHAQAQRDRGGHYPGGLPNPLPIDLADTAKSPEPSTAQNARGGRPKRPRTQKRRAGSPADPDALTLPFPVDPTTGEPT